MNLVKRTLEADLKKYFKPGKVTVLYGPRRAGKTTLINQVITTLGDKALYLRGEEKIVNETFSSNESFKMKNLIGDKKYLIIDEAQTIPNIGENLKLFIDSFPEIAVLASGSSSFDLAKKVGEPLTGRQNVFTLFPFSFSELLKSWGRVKALSMLEEVLVYGSYPETINLTNLEEKRKSLELLINSYLYRDILDFEAVKNSGLIFNLLSLIAYQIGKEVSLTELAGQLQISKNTVGRYLDLLEKSFVLINIRGFSRNLRSEVTKNSRYYFWDNGVRNALISNLNPVSRRGDVGELWENFLVVERLKKQKYSNQFANNYFWRTYSQQEIDWVEDKDGQLNGYEFKWGKKSGKIPPSWKESYPKAVFDTINKDNYLDFITYDLG